jgi:hypothetical protein
MIRTWSIEINDVPILSLRIGAEVRGRATCSSCGLRISNTAAIWLGRTWDDRSPFCAECAPAEERRLARLGV